MKRAQIISFNGSVGSYFVPFQQFPDPLPYCFNEDANSVILERYAEPDIAGKVELAGWLINTSFRSHVLPQCRALSQPLGTPIDD